MASEDLREELNCSICLEVYRDPVTLRCGHNFCRKCIDQLLGTQDQAGVYTCPDCRKRFTSRPSVVRNNTLHNISELFHSSEAETSSDRVYCVYCDLPVEAVKTCLQCETSMCERHLRNHNRSVQHILLDPTASLENRKCAIHKKILDYYCAEDSAFICSSCGLREHQGHQVELLDELVKKKQEELRNVLEKVNSKTEQTEEIIRNLYKDVAKIQRQAERVTKGINEMFQDMKRQLENLKESLICDVVTKKHQSLLSCSDLIQELEKEKEELLASKRHLEEQCNMADPYKVLQEETQSGFPDGVVRSCAPSYRSGDMDLSLISQTLHTILRNIISGMNLWFYTQEPADVCLDITTAANNVHISADLRCATYTKETQNFQETAQRFQMCQVLSTISFASGRHYWDVDTSNLGNWRVGVCYPSMARHGDESNIGYNCKSWTLRRCNNEFLVRHNADCVMLPHVTVCNSLRVFLDYEAGQLSFYDREDPIRPLHTISATFTEPLHAAFMVCGSCIKIRELGDRTERL
ncbi:E3 ubiquitin/ISG15 ligase TRIM25-like [Dendrobates tinctorius]|uniref:E3 ubiquitin/ISG15 ligase TRIM25-like n=1 Tax=Dendrobates tinctorius TaxID=92724 RepID=UPI003CCA4DCD